MTRLRVTFERSLLRHSARALVHTARLLMPALTRLRIVRVRVHERVAPHSRCTSNRFVTDFPSLRSVTKYMPGAKLEVLRR